MSGIAQGRFTLEEDNAEELFGTSVCFVVDTRICVKVLLRRVMFLLIMTASGKDRGSVCVRRGQDSGRKSVHGRKEKLEEKFFINTSMKSKSDLAGESMNNSWNCNISFISKQVLKSCGKNMM